MAAFVWDGSKLVPTDARTLAKRSDFEAMFSFFGPTMSEIVADG